MKRPLLSIALGALALMAGAGRASAYCPCYTASSAYNTHDCGIEAAPGKNPSVSEWNTIFDLVSQGPSVWGDKGPTVGNIGEGCGKPEAWHSVAARFPCELLKAIAMHESGWRQFCVPDLPKDEVGGAERTIISFDCGYGVGQVTSGMHAGETPSFDRSRVASDATYNLATGTRILADKWKATSCVGDNQPAIIEDWYAATWAYNGLAYVNNPNNPNYDTNRGVWNPQVGGGAPYQERVFGWIEHTLGKWTPTALAYPNPGDIGGASKPPALPEPDCASPTDCIGKRPVHATSCNGSAGGSGGGSGSGSGGGGGGNGSGGDSGAGVGGGDGGEGGSLSDGNQKGSCACETGPGANARGAGPGAVGLLALAGLGALGRRRRGAGPFSTRAGSLIVRAPEEGPMPNPFHRSLPRALAALLSLTLTTSCAPVMPSPWPGVAPHVAVATDDAPAAAECPPPPPPPPPVETPRCGSSIGAVLCPLAFFAGGTGVLALAVLLTIGGREEKPPVPAAGGLGSSPASSVPVIQW